MIEKCSKCGNDFLECFCNIPETLPCPFCGWENIRIVEDEIVDEKHIFFGSKRTYCWCKVCGSRGPWTYSVDDHQNIVFINCIKRWNERFKEND